MPPSDALLDGFAIGAQVVLLWQLPANPSYQLASAPRYDNIVRMQNVSECSVVCTRSVAGWNCLNGVKSRSELVN